jgi:maleamate amidohydrolase
MSNSDISSLHANYSNGAFGQQLGFGTKQALVMIDFAKAYFMANSRLYANSSEIIPRAKALLQWARTRGMLVCHTRVEYRADGLDGGVFFARCLLSKSSAAATLWARWCQNWPRPPTNQ